MFFKYLTTVRLCIVKISFQIMFHSYVISKLTLTTNLNQKKQNKTKEEVPHSLRSKNNILHRKAGLYTYFSLEHSQTLKADIPLPPVTSDSV